MCTSSNALAAFSSTRTRFSTRRCAKYSPTTILIIVNMNGRLLLEVEALRAYFMSQCILVYSLEEAAAEGIGNLKGPSNDRFRDLIEFQSAFICVNLWFTVHGDSFFGAIS